MKSLINYLLVCLILLITPSCAVVGGIFKAGMVWGIILVLGFIGLIIFLITRAGKK